MDWIRKPVAGWECVHKTARTILLIKKEPMYGLFTPRPYGFVLVRGEPGMDDREIVDKAYTMAEENDAWLGLKMAEKLLPPEWKAKERAQKFGADAVLVSAGIREVVSVAEFRRRQAAIGRLWATPEDPQIRIYRP